MRAAPDCTYAFLDKVEGDRLVAYQDSGGVWTIGRGHTGLAIGPGLVIDQVTSDGYLRSDINRFAAVVCREVADDQVIGALTAHEYAALISFAFNLGTLGPSIPKLLRAGNLAAVPPLMLRYDHARVKGKLIEVPGLENRRTAEVTLWNTGDVETAAAVAQAAPQPSSSVVRAMDTPPVPLPSAKPLSQSKTIWGGATVMLGGAIGVANQVKDAAAPLADAAPFIAKAAEYASVTIFAAGLAIVFFRYLDEKAKRT